jgi:hypothetical protein
MESEYCKLNYRRPNTVLNVGINRRSRYWDKQEVTVRYL